MAYSTLQPRAPTAYFPPHHTQLHPRMHSFSSAPLPPQKARLTKFLLLLASLFTVPFLFYLFSTARKVHQSPRFAEPTSQFFGVHIHLDSTGSRIRVFEFLGEGRVPFVASMRVRPGIAEEPENAGSSVDELMVFAKSRVPRREWGKTKVQVMATGKEMESLGMEVKERILEECRQVLRKSGFSFKDEWARVIRGVDETVYAWIAVNYAFGTLGGEPQETTGVVKLGGASLQVIFALKEPSEVQDLQSIKLAGVTYTLYTQSLPQLGQNAAWKSLHKLQNSRELTSMSESRGPVGNPCIPRGYELTSNQTAIELPTHSAGNFSMCRSEALALLKRKQEKCLHPPCKIFSSFFLKLKGKPVSPANFFYTSELFGLVPRASLSELMAAGQHYCEDGWDDLQNRHPNVDDLDLFRYCFSSAYMVALLHDNLGLPMHDKRIGFANQSEAMPLDWTLGAFLLQSVLEPAELEPGNPGQIVGSESVTYFSLFAFLLIALLAVFFVLQWQKPKLKTIYDLEKGHYIVTRVPR